MATSPKIDFDNSISAKKVAFLVPHMTIGRMETVFGTDINGFVKKETIFV